MQALTHIRKLEQKLGVGAYGVVYLGIDEVQGRLVAIKEIPYYSSPYGDGDNDGDHGSSVANAILQEMRIMQRAKQHANLVGYYGARRCPVGVQLVMEYMGGGSLERLLKLSGRLPEAVVQRYTRDILRGLQYLHEELRVCHRDIKPGNVLLSPEGRCKLTDFGVSKILVTANTGKDRRPRRCSGGNGTGGSGGGSAGDSSGEDDTAPTEDPFMQTAIGTSWYMAPEVISGGEGVEEEPDSEGMAGDGAAAAAEGEGEGEGEEEESSSYYNPLRGIAYRGEGGTSLSTEPNGVLGGDGGVYVSRYERNMRARGYTTSADIWSVGVTVFEMISGQKPFGSGLTNPTAVLFRIINSAAQPPKLPCDVRDGVSHELRNFLDQCFVYDKALRPSAAELLAHPWLSSAGLTNRAAGGGSGSVSMANSTGDVSPRLSDGTPSRRGSAKPQQQQQHPQRHSNVTSGPQHRSSAGSQTGQHHQQHQQQRPSLSHAAACSPMLDVVDVPLAPVPPRRRSAGSRSSERPSSGAQHGPPYQRCSGSPYNDSASSSSVPSPPHPKSGGGQQSQQQHYNRFHLHDGRQAASDSVPREYSIPPELPALPENVNRRGNGGGGGGLASPLGRRSPATAVRHPPPPTTEGLFSLDGHYVDLITRLPSPRHN